MNTVNTPQKPADEALALTGAALCPDSQVTVAESVPIASDALSPQTQNKIKNGGGFDMKKHSLRGFAKAVKGRKEELIGEIRNEMKAINDSLDRQSRTLSCILGILTEFLSLLEADNAESVIRRKKVERARAKKAMRRFVHMDRLKRKSKKHTLSARSSRKKCIVKMS